MQGARRDVERLSCPEAAGHRERKRIEGRREGGRKGGEREHLHIVWEVKKDEKSILSPKEPGPLLPLALELFSGLKCTG